MRRRRLVTASALGAAATILARPALAASMPEVRWRLASSFPNTLTTLFGGATFLAERVAALTDGKFIITPFAAGQIVPALQVLDAVQNGTVEMGHTAPYYYVGKDPTFAFACAVPFGFNARQQQAWMLAGGALERTNEFLKAYDVIGRIAGNTGAQMGGWFRKEIKTVDDIRGLKFCIAGLAGTVIGGMGGVAQQIGGGDIYPALESGAIDAAAWMGPFDDERLGFDKIAKYYYYPGWWAGNAQIWLYCNLPKYQHLPPAYQAALESACAETNTRMQAQYDAENPAALRRLVANGAELRPFPRDIMQAAYLGSFELYARLAAENARFRRMFEAWKTFRTDELLWFRVAENSYENFIYARSAAEARGTQ